MNLLGELTHVIEQQTDQFLDFIPAVCRWVSHYNQELVEAAFGALFHIVSSNAGMQMMVECGGLAQVINTLANINIELKEHQQYIDAKKRGLAFE